VNREQTQKLAGSLALTILFCIGTNGQRSSNRRLPPAQQGRPEKTGSRQGGAQEETRDLLLARRFAQGRLENVGDRAKSLDDSIMKVKVLGRVADAMWSFDETRARQFFMLAFKAIDGIRLDAKEDQRIAITERRGGGFGPLFHLRDSILQLVARHDFKLADDLRKSSEVDANQDGKKNPAYRDEQKHIYLDMAVALAETQPERAARLIRGSFGNEIDPSLVYALLRMRGTSHVLADQLFKEAIGLASLHQMLPSELEALALYVLPNEEDLFFGNDPLNDVTRVPIVRRFLEYVYSGSSGLVRTIEVSAAKGNGSEHEEAEEAYHTLEGLLPMFERLQPAQANYVREEMGVLLGFMTPQDSNRATSSPKETVEDLVRKAESAVGERRRTIGFIRASAAALNEGDIDRALAIAERIDDLHERKVQTSLILYQSAMRQLRQGKLEAGYNYGRRIEFLPQRVIIFNRMAEKLWKEKEPDKARSMLEELWDWLEKADNNPQKANAMLKVTATMAQHDKERGFELLRSTAKTLNSTDFSFKGFDQNAISVELHIAPDMLDLDSSFIALTGSDPERVQAIAQSLTKPELSLLAQAIVCQQVLTLR
jgi:hypothetical protein